MELAERIAAAVEARLSLLDPKHQGALRLFNGFFEGHPALALDLYGRTLVIHDYSESVEGDESAAKTACQVAEAKLPFVRAALWKVRSARQPEQRNGRLLLGTAAELDRKVVEHGVRYALELSRHQDATLYLDTRNLRAWAKAQLAGQRVLNTFAYTGSLGVAAQAAPASEVVQVDLNRSYLNLAKASYALNGFGVKRADFRVGDFFDESSRLKKEGRLFDCVFLDPPFFSQTQKGRVDQEASPERLINKVRPLIADGGRLVAVNNALFLSGKEYLARLEALCSDGFMAVEELIPVAEDFVGRSIEGAPSLPADPAPFNHSTKIAVLRVRRRDGRRD